MPDSPTPVVHQWVHVTYQETSSMAETYGFSGSQGEVNLEGVLIEPKRRQAKTLLLMMHPSSTLQLLPLPTALARAGHSVLCMGSRYAKNDTAMIFEKVVLDLGACVRYAKEQLGFEKVCLLGWSGGGSLALLYQAQAEKPTIRQTPGGDPIDLSAAKLLAADSIVLEAAHRSRARCLCDWIDPSITDESNPDRRDVRFDLYSPDLPVAPPYPADWLAEYRQAQYARVQRITAWARETLDQLKRLGTAETERGFITHRTMADPRFLDASIDPNERQIGHCYLGVPETVNSGPVGLARYSTLRAWLSQWSVDDSMADGESCAALIQAPLLAVEHGADDAVPQPDVGLMYGACSSTEKTYYLIAQANHYMKGQPDQLNEAVGLINSWVDEHNG